MQRFKIRTLSLVSLILLAACSQKTVYVQSDCLLLPDITITDEDKEALLETQDLLSYQFLKSLRDYKDQRKANCKNA